MKKLITLSIITVVILLMGSTVLAVEYNFNGETVTFANYWDMRESDFSEPQDIARLERIQEEWNVNIEFTTFTWGDVKEKIISSVMAGDAIADVAYVAPGHGVSLSIANALYPLSQALDKDYWDNYWTRVPPGITRESYRRVNEEFAFFTGHVGGPSMIYFNKDLFEREGLPDPYQLIDNDQWNWNNFKEIAINATKDLDGDGKTDQFGFGGYAGAGSILMHLLYSNDASITRTNENGRVVLGYNNSAGIATLEFFKELIMENHVNPVYEFNVAGNEGKEFFWNGKSAMVATTTGYADEIAENSDINFGVVPYPKGPSADEYVGMNVGHNWFVIPVTVDKDLKSLIELTSALFELTTPYVDDPKDVVADDREEFVNSVTDRKSVEIYDMIMEHTVTGKYWFASTNPLVHNLEKGLSPAAAIEAEVPHSQALIAEKLGYED